MNYPLPDEAARQVESGMHWKQEGACEYLITTGRGNRQQRLGARSLKPDEGTFAPLKRHLDQEDRCAAITASGGRTCVTPFPPKLSSE